VTPSSPAPLPTHAPEEAGLSPFWRRLFAFEVLVCLATVLFWLVAPGDYLAGFYGLERGAPAPYLLLQQSSAVVFCAYVYLYAALLRMRPFPMAAFRRLQEAMAIGDVLVLGSAVAAWRQLQPEPALWWAQVGMATLWLTLRVLWLWRTARTARTAREVRAARP
jgi:hypothetical protein